MGSIIDVIITNTTRSNLSAKDRYTIHDLQYFVLSSSRQDLPTYSHGATN
jgi:hypothetical protein